MSENDANEFGVYVQVLVLLYAILCFAIAASIGGWQGFLYAPGIAMVIMWLSGRAYTSARKHWEDKY